MVQPTLLGVPYDASSSGRRGAADAPPLIREELWSPATSTWSERGVDIRESLADAGDLPLPTDTNPREAIETAVSALLDRGAHPIILGGDHSITYPAARAFRRLRPGFDILHLDAHPDLYDAFEGDRYSHACPFARIMEEGLAGKLVQVGIRNVNRHQWEQAQRFHVHIIMMKEWIQGARFHLEQPVYLSIDVDAIDPAFAPGVSHREPGGLSVRDVIDIIQNLPVPVIGVDIVEYNARRDMDGMTAAVAAKLVKEIVGQMVVMASDGAIRNS